MSEDAAERVRELVDAVYRAESRRVLATLRHKFPVDLRRVIA
jgi:hypothetical protein